MLDLVEEILHHSFREIRVTVLNQPKDDEITVPSVHFIEPAAGNDVFVGQIKESCVGDFTRLDVSDVLDAARQAEIEIGRGNYRGPLHGLPFGVKDQLCTRGVKTTLGSRIYADHVPDYDATVITRLRDAGAILIGKENLHEFGKGGTHMFAHGQPRNPWDIERNPGSSSSGSGIAPAAGFSSGSIGEDTGMIGMDFGVNFCVVGLDRNWSYGPACRAARR